MSRSKYKNIEPQLFDQVSTYELSSRPSKVDTDKFSKAIGADADLGEFFESLPDILAVKSIRALAASIVTAKTREKPVIWGLGGHVIKTGLAPVLIDLIKNGYVTAIACNGSVLVHDSEIARAGFTSEDVDVSLGAGTFGAARETGELLNSGAELAFSREIGLGEAFSELLVNESPRFSDMSLLCAAYDSIIPVTAHITIGADIGHFHPETDGSAIGKGSHYDFRLFTAIVGEMNDGGVYLNCGSAVTLPEVFLKAITVNRNIGKSIENITTANLDFIQHYRPLTNVVRRPTANGAGNGYAITGHHEIMIPLLAAAIYQAEKQSSKTDLD